MPKPIPILLGALAVLAAAPAAAAPRGHYAPAYQQTNNALRLEIGGATLSSPGLCLNGASFDCVDSSPFAWQALSVGGELDVGLGAGPAALTLGAHEIAGSWYDGTPSIFEPSLAVTFRFMRHQPLQPRLAIGAGFMLGDDGTTGAALKLGAGLSFFGNAPLGLALDLLVDIGRFGDYGITQVQFMVGPEFHF